MNTNEYFCTNCGSRINGEQIFCSKCGARVKKLETPAPQTADAMDSIKEISKNISNKAANFDSGSFFQNLGNTLKRVPKKVYGIVIAAAAVLIAAVCAFNAPKPVDLDSVYVVEFDGSNGMGNATAYVDPYSLAALLASDTDDSMDIYSMEDMNDLADAFQTGVSYYSLMNSFEMTLDKDSDLTNGDTVTATITYNEELAKEMNMKFKNTTKTFTVSGLKELETIDAFEDLEIEYYGASPELEIKSIHGKYNDLYLTYTANKTEGIANGDVITITCDTDAGILADQGYALADDATEITVADHDAYVTDISQLSEANMEEIKENAIAVCRKENTNEGASYVNSCFGSQITYEDPEYVGILVANGNQGIAHSSIYVIYRCTGTFTRTESGKAYSTNGIGEAITIENYQVIEVDDVILSGKDGSLILTDFDKTEGQIHVVDTMEGNEDDPGWTVDGFESLDAILQSCKSVDGYTRFSATEGIPTDSTQVQE